MNRLSLGTRARALDPDRVFALAKLLYAFETAQELRRPPWEFACQLGSLNQVGIDDTVLRWLVNRGYAKHRHETTRAGQRRRTFRPIANLRFARESSFILTPAGVALARDNGADWQRHGQHDVTGVGNGAALPPGRRPRWEPGRRLLRIGSIVIKQFRVPAANQALILAAFEEEKWPPLIDDPLPPRADVDPKRRLHDAINRLNRNQKQRLLHFYGDGSGRGIGWGLVIASR